jgi:ketopantoate hydroxymethyltransferase
MMAGEPDTATARPTFDQAISHAARLLQNAELEADLHRMERVERLADSWLSMAAHIGMRERDAT